MFFSTFIFVENFLKLLLSDFRILIISLKFLLRAQQHFSKMTPMWYNFLKTFITTL